MEACSDNKDNVSEAQPLHKLISLLGEMGIRAESDGLKSSADGYPFTLELPSGEQVTLDLDTPPLVSKLDPSEIGVAVVDAMGYTVRSWGFATQLDTLRPDISAFETDLALLIQAATRGTPGIMYLDGVRYYASGYEFEKSFDVVVIVTNASEEQDARQHASRSSKSAEALRRVGKALTMNQNLSPLCSAAVQEIASSTELAAVLLWVHQPESDGYELVGSVGANREGTHALQTLRIDAECSCLAELVGGSRRTFTLNSVYENMMTAHLEAKFCYLPPGGLMTIPLVSGDRLIGMLELIARKGDTEFLEFSDLYETIAEHLALALNSAILFDSIEKLASKDPLTGVANHRCMQEFLDRRVNESSRTQADLGVIMIDVDHFRALNEEEGHDTGDMVLRRIVDVLRECIRPYDMAARYGGEEFTIIMPGGGEQTTLAVAERIRQRIEAMEIVTLSGHVRHVTVSSGVAIFPKTSRDAAGLLRAADKALYQAKRNGRNRVVLFEGALDEPRVTSTVDLDRILSWLTPRERAEALARAERAHPLVHHLVTTLGLSKGQEAILSALIIFAPHYRETLVVCDAERLEEFRRAAELRVLLPTLTTLTESYDGSGPLKLSGPRIPMLTRVLQVIEAILDRPAELWNTEGQYDPQILQIASDMPDAA